MATDQDNALDKQIALLDRARSTLAEVHTLEQAAEVRAKAKALRGYFNAVKNKYESAKESQYYAAEVMVRADRRMGELLKDMKERGERHNGRNTDNLKHRESQRATPDEWQCSECNDRFPVRVAHCLECDHHYPPEDKECGNCHKSLARAPKSFRVVSESPTLADLGIDKDQASRAMQLAALPEDRFEAHIEEAREKSYELTLGGMLRHARNFVKEQRREETRDELAALGATLTDQLPDTVTLVCGDFRDCLDELPDESVDLIFTDPPYDWDTVPLYTDLARHAARILKPGGHLLAYAGHYALDKILPAMGEHLRYWWTIALKHHGGSARLIGKYVFVEWKPIVWFVKGERHDKEWIADLFESKVPDKSRHWWAQDESEAAYYVEHLTPVHGLVVDPFMGSGTTLAAAATQMRRVWGCDIDADNVAIAKGVIHNALSECAAGELG